MNPPSLLIPQLPDSAPFTGEQRAYLNGFLAGLLSRATLPAAVVGPSPVQTLQPLAILFGSQSGNAERLAKRLAKEAGKQGFAPTVHDLAKYPPSQLASERQVLVVTSTYGDGDPPDNAKGFWEFLKSDTAPALPQTRFAVAALGDSNYARFCQFGKELDERFEKLGARRVHPRVDCDVEADESFARWLAGTLPALASASGVAPVAAGWDALPHVPDILEDAPSPQYSRTNPLPARLTENRSLCGTGSNKDVRHLEFDLADSGLTYEAGDALGVMPANAPELVAEIIQALDCDGEAAVPGRDGGAMPLRLALLGHYDITRISAPFLAAFAERTGDAELQRLAAPNANGELSKFLFGREIIDLLLAHPAVKLSPAEFVALLKKLQPRSYSIASSPKAHAGSVHLTVGVVRYSSLGRQRQGVCSAFLAERAGAGPVPIFAQPNKNFRLPADPARDMLMVGPGTGIAPFRAFLHERRATGATGRNWLFFGDQHAATDFLYHEELRELQHAGALTRLDTAFSRDQADKVYVQHRLLQQAQEVFAWLDGGAHFYVCGDAARMAKDVDTALHQVIATGGGLSADQAAEYVRRMQAEKRYQRDVY